MSEIHLRQPIFRYSACGPFKKNEYKNLKTFMIYLSKETRQSMFST